MQRYRLRGMSALPVAACMLASGCADATVKLWSCKDHRLLATLVQLTPRTNEWLIVTPPGYLATSSPAALRWKAEKVSLGPGQVTALLQNSAFVGKVMA